MNNSFYGFPIRPEDILHYGIKRKSGRYPWGSGERPYQRSYIAYPTEIKKISDSRRKIKTYNRSNLTQYQIDRYKNQSRNLSHLRVSETTKGVLYKKHDKVVGVVNTENKNGDVWIQGLEVFGDFKGKGLSRGLLDVAVKDLGATNLSVRKTNTVALDVYKKYGFDIYDSNDSMYFMHIDLESMNKFLDDMIEKVGDREINS